ncbi:MAG: hypothetical protein COS08_05580, partial [Euryarchaeota archaeon CG01_land_8_20_14_3_00_38_12]
RQRQCSWSWIEIICAFNHFITKNRMILSEFKVYQVVRVSLIPILRKSQGLFLGFYGIFRKNS